MKACLGATIRWRWPGAAGAVLLATLAAVPSQGDEFASDAARLAKAFKLSTGQTVADIGAGGGQLTMLLARAVGPTGRVYATELDTSRVRSIREAAAAAGLKNVSVIEGHHTRTNLPERCCDALVVRFVYHHFGEPGLMNAGLRESLRPGGLLAVIDFRPKGTESEDPAGRTTGDHHGVTPATVIRELRQAGFDSVAVDNGNRTTGFMVVVRRPSAQGFTRPGSRFVVQ